MLSSGISSATCFRFPGAESSTWGVGTGAWRPATWIDSTRSFSATARSLSYAMPGQLLGSRAVLVAADIARLPFKAASFDCVLTIRVLQHVHDLQGTLGEMRRVIAGDGRLLFSYHNKRNAKRILRHFAARGDANPFSLEPTELRPTLISRHPSELEAHMHEAGFSAPDYQGTGVVNWLADITDRFRRRTPAGATWAPLMGRFRLAPWLVGTVVREGSLQLHGGDAIEDMFQCPSCEGDLSRSDTGFECSRCHRDYPIVDGIADFRL